MTEAIHIVSPRVKIAKFCDMTGYTRSAVDNKIHRGDWLEGYEYVRSSNGEVTVDIVGYNRWAANLPRVPSSPTV